MAVTKKFTKPTEAAPVVAAPAPVAAAPVEAPVESGAAPAAPVAAPEAAVVTPFESANDLLKPFAALPETFRANAEQGLENFRTQYAALKGNAESFSGKIEESLAAAQSGMRVFNGKVLDVFRAQVDAGFAHISALFNATTLMEAIKLQQSYQSAQAEALKAQSQDLADYAKQVAEQVAEPVKSTITLPFKAA